MEKTRATPPRRRSSDLVAFLVVLSLTSLGGIGFARTSQSSLPHEAASKGCLSPGVISDYIVGEYVSLMGRNDPTATRLLSIAGVPKVPANAIALVSDTTKCRKAAEAYSAALAKPDSNRLVHLIKVGARYLVVDTVRASDPRYLVVVFDTLFSQPPLSVLAK